LLIQCIGSTAVILVSGTINPCCCCCHSSTCCCCHVWVEKER
jgi:hypothetical protein